MFQKKYSKIYTAYDEYGYIQLLLYNDVNADALFFDGLNFFYKPSMINIPSDFKELKDAVNPTNSIYEVEEIKQSDDLTFIKFKNGDIFQLYFMLDDNKPNQILSIFRKDEHNNINTPLGVTSYEAVLRRFNAAEECDIAVEE